VKGFLGSIKELLGNIIEVAFLEMEKKTLLSGKRRRERFDGRIMSRLLVE
jgi:hypothetical protein